MYVQNVNDNNLHIITGENSMYEFEEVVHWIDYNIELKKFTL
jgi:hypothetical protein